VARREISADYFDVAFFEDVADVTLGTIVHTCALYVVRDATFPAYPPFSCVTLARDMMWRAIFGMRATGRGWSRRGATIDTVQFGRDGAKSRRFKDLRGNRLTGRIHLWPLILGCFHSPE
jgi:hypothetical protein